MKKSTIIGLALAGILNQATAQSVLAPQSQSVTVTATLQEGVGASLMAQAVIPRGTIRLVGTNVVIGGYAQVIVPATVAAQWVVSVPDGYDITNLAPSTFEVTTNGVVVHPVFVKTTP